VLANFLIPLYGWPILFYIQGFLTFISLIIVCIRKDDFKEIDDRGINYKIIYQTKTKNETIKPNTDVI